MGRKKDSRTEKMPTKPARLVDSLQKLQDQVTLLKSQGDTKYSKLLQIVIKRLEKM